MVAVNCLLPGITKEQHAVIIVSYGTTIFRIPEDIPSAAINGFYNDGELIKCLLEAINKSINNAESLRENVIRPIMDKESYPIEYLIWL